MRVLIVVLLLALSGCAEDGASPVAGEPAETTPTAAEPAPAPTKAEPPVFAQGVTRIDGIEDLSGQAKPALRLVAYEGDASAGSSGSAFKPTLIKVDAGASIAVTVDNTGNTDHDFVVESQKIDVRIPNGKKSNVTVKMPDKDGLRFFCRLHPTMAGAFYSKEGQDVQR